MSRFPRLALAVLAALIAAGAWWWTRREREVEPVQRAETLASVANDTPEAPTVVEAREETAPAPPTSRIETERLLSEIRGRFVDESGAPIAGVELVLSGREANSERTRAWNRQIAWENVVAKSDAGGSFSLRFDPPPPYVMKLDASAAGRESAVWEWHEISLGEAIELGEVALHGGATIHGIVVDAGGFPVSAGWNVRMESLGLTSGADRNAVWAIASPGEEPGGFLFEGVPPGRCALELRLDAAPGRETKREVELAAGETAEIELRYDGPDLSRSITVSLSFGKFVLSRGLDAGAATWLESASGARITNSKSTGRMHELAFDELEPGLYSIVVEHDGFEPFRQDGVAAGSAVRVKLAGTCAIEANVIDAETREPVLAYELSLQPSDARAHRLPWPLRVASNPAPDGEIYRGLPPGDWLATVKSSGFEPAQVALSALAPGEVRYALFELRPGTRISGRVLRSDGTPLGRREVVRLYRPAEVEDGPQSEYLPSGSSTGKDERMRREVEQRIADSDGSFTFEDVPPGRYVLRARVGPRLASTLDVDLHPGERLDALELRLPEFAELSGRVLAPPAASLAGLTLRIGPAPVYAGDMETMRDALGVTRSPPGRSKLASDGSFRVRELATGAHEAWLVIPANSAGRSWGSMATEIPLGSVELVAGANSRDFDLRAQFPGSVEVRVTVDGAPAAGLAVDLRRAQRVEGQFDTTLSAVTNSRGVARLAHVPVGAWRASIEAPENEWSSELPAELLVSSGSSIAESISIALIEGEVLVRAPTDGVSTAGRSVSIHMGGDERSMLFAARRLDETGRLRLRWPAGRIVIQAEIDSATGELAGELLPDESKTATASFEWTPAGPVPAEVRLRIE